MGLRKLTLSSLLETNKRLQNILSTVARTMDGKRKSRGSLQLDIPNSTLDDLCSRFLLNIPATEKHDMIRLCFQIELAHWFYLDFHRQEKPALPDCKVREFAKLVFLKYPFLLKPSNANVDEVIEKWREYKRSVPTYGAVILDETMEHVLLVQGFVVRSNWGFPKGKVNKDETPEACAAREVMEETGFDITSYIKPSQFIELQIMEQLTRLYYVVGVPALTKFEPKTRGEIKSVEWFNLDDLPCHKKDQTPKQNLSLGPNSFFMVIPFVKAIRKWVSTQKNQLQVNGKRPTRNSSPSKKPQLLNKKVEGMTKAEFESSSSKTLVDNAKSQPKPASLTKDDELRQRQYFSRANNKELQTILNIKSRKDSTQGKRNGVQNHLNYPPSPVPSHSYSASRGRGRTYCESMPDCWKNFKIDEEALMKIIDEFAPFRVHTQQHRS